MEGYEQYNVDDNELKSVERAVERSKPGKKSKKKLMNYLLSFLLKVHFQKWNMLVIRTTPSSKKS